MRHITFILLISIPLLSYGQQGVVVAGGDLAGINGSMSFSTGQTDFSTLDSGEYSLLFGLQQPADYMEVAVDELPATADGIFRVFPNPAAEQFTLSLPPDSKDQTAVVRLYDMHGKRIKQRHIESSLQHTFSLSGQPAGIYLLRISFGDMNSTKRIIKQ